jgi:hypothetical protein
MTRAPSEESRFERRRTRRRAILCHSLRQYRHAGLDARWHDRDVRGLATEAPDAVAGETMMSIQGPRRAIDPSAPTTNGAMLRFAVRPTTWHQLASPKRSGDTFGMSRRDPRRMAIVLPQNPESQSICARLFLIIIKSTDCVAFLRPHFVRERAIPHV